MLEPYFFEISVNFFSERLWKDWRINKFRNFRESFATFWEATIPERRVRCGMGKVLGIAHIVAIQRLYGEAYFLEVWTTSSTASAGIGTARCAAPCETHCSKYICSNHGFQKKCFPNIFSASSETVSKGFESCWKRTWPEEALVVAHGKC